MHVSENEWKIFYNSGSNKVRVLEHVSECDYCAARMADMIPQEELINPAPYLKTEILNKTVNYHMVKKKALGIDYMLYCVKIGLAMCFALFVLFSGNLRGIEKSDRQYSHEQTAAGFEQDGSHNAISGKIRDAAGSVNKTINDFYNRAVNFNFEREGKNNEDEKK